jgi:hypothetical protein
MLTSRLPSTGKAHVTPRSAVTRPYSLEGEVKTASFKAEPPSACLAGGSLDTKKENLVCDDIRQPTQPPPDRSNVLVRSADIRALIAVGEKLARRISDLTVQLDRSDRAA